MTTETTTRCDDGQCSHTIAECPAFQASELPPTPEATAGEWRLKEIDGLRGTEGYSNVDVAIVDADDYVVGIVYEAGSKGAGHHGSRYTRNAASIISDHNSVQRLREALQGVAIMLNTELKQYESEPWAQRVRAVLESLK